MRDALTHFSEIGAALGERGVVILLDFDGTLAPLVPQYEDAVMSHALCETLTRLARGNHLAIVSGRGVSDVRRRVGVRGIIYAGCHGLELYARGRRTILISDHVRYTFTTLKRTLKKIAASYPSVRIEDKSIGIAFHYRALSPSERRTLWRRVTDVACAVPGYAVRVLDDTYTLDVMPAGEDKGRVVERIIQILSPHARPPLIYIGDALTDEDVFRRFPRDIMVRVGKKVGSRARYYLRTQGDVEVFLRAVETAL